LAGTPKVFPNTLIEAGINAVPYISFVDPDEVIYRYKLGEKLASRKNHLDMSSVRFSHEKRPNMLS
jgi:hypothetical protein